RLVSLLCLADREAHREGRAVLAETVYVAADTDDLALARASIIVEIGVVLLCERCRHEDVDVSADDFLCRIAEEPYRCGVEIQNTTAGVDGDDAVGCRPYHRAQPFEQVAFTLLDPLTRTDVLGRGDYLLQRPLGVEQASDRGHGLDHRTVLAPTAALGAVQHFAALHQREPPRELSAIHEKFGW